MKHLALLCALALPLAVPAPLAAGAAAQAQAPMSLGEWLANDRDVQALAPGPAREAAISMHVAAIIRAFTTARDQQRAKAAAGQPLDACLPPPGTELTLTLREIGEWLYGRPSREHGDALSAVITRFLAERYPCR